jgi:transposase
LIGLSAGTRVYLRCGPTDLRKSFDGLAQIVEDDLRRDILDGDLVFFCNRSRNRIKAVYWDGSGLCLFAKRLDGGRFAWPQSAEAAREITPAELTMLLEGIDFRDARHRVWSRRRPIERKPLDPREIRLTR